MDIGTGAESQLATDGEKVAQAKQIIDLALDLAKDCAASYRKGRPEVRKMWNRAFFRTILVRRFHVRGALHVRPRFTQRLDGGPKGMLFELLE